MTIWRAARRIGRGLVVCAVTGLFLQVVVGLALAIQARADSTDTTSLEGLRTQLDEIEAALGRDDTTPEALAGLRAKLNAATDALRANIDELEPRAHEVEERLKQLGPAPGKDAPPETTEIAAERAELTRSFGDLDGRLKEARVLSVRIDQLSERVAQKRHALYARELLARSASVLDPFFWSEAFRALPTVLVRAEALLEIWRDERADAGRLAAAALLLIAITAVAIGATRWWLPRLAAGPYATSAAKAWAALAVFIWFTARTPVASLAAFLALDTLGLLTTRLEQIALGLIAGIAAAAFGHGVARALFAVEMPQRRLLAEDDATARCFHDHLVWASRVLGVVIPLQVINKTLFAPLVITVATNALFAAVVAGFLVHLVIRLGSIKNIQGGGLVAATWIHPVALLASVLIALALIAGFAGLAAFLGLRVIVAAAVFGALYLLSAVTHTLFAAIGEDTAKGQRLAASLGISARSLGIGGACR
jgi:potassium efflux system protein